MSPLRDLVPNHVAPERLYLEAAGRLSYPAHSGDLERSFRSIMNAASGDHEHPHGPA
jgi:hypothetical protein